MATKAELSDAAQRYAAETREIERLTIDRDRAEAARNAAIERRRVAEVLLRGTLYGAIQVRTWPVWDAPNTSKTSRVVVVHRVGEGVLVDVVGLEADHDKAPTGASAPHPAAPAGEGAAT